MAGRRLGDLVDAAATGILDPSANETANKIREALATQSGSYIVVSFDEADEQNLETVHSMWSGMTTPTPSPVEIQTGTRTSNKYVPITWAAMHDPTTQAREKLLKISTGKEATE